MVTIIHTDGGSRGNPGPSAAGIWIPSSKSRSGYYLGDGCTNNEAEYSALILALIKAQVNGLTEIEIRSDSELMVKQMKGSYAVRAAKIKPLHAKALEMESALRSVKYTYVPRAANAEADKICNEVMDRAANNPDEVVYSFVAK